MRESVLPKALNPLGDLLARILGEEPAQFGAVAVLQGAFDDERRGGLRVELREVVFLKERGEGGRDGHGYLTTNIDHERHEPHEKVLNFFFSFVYFVFFVVPIRS